MILYIENSNPEIHFDDNFEQEIEYMKGYMNKNPQFYGMSIGAPTTKEITQGIEKYV